MTKKIGRNYILNILAELQRSEDCRGNLEHKVLSVNNNSLRFMFPLGTEDKLPDSQTMVKLREFGKACMQMGWFMAIESMRKEMLK